MHFNIFGGGERRSLENPSRSLSDPANWFDTGRKSASGINVTEESALGVPAIWQAINLIAGTIGHLPLHLYKVDKNGQPTKDTKNTLYTLLHDRANDVHSKSVFFKMLVWRALAGSKGRGLALITKNVAGRVAGFIPLDETAVTIEQTIEAGRLVRTYTIGSNTYAASDIFDLAPVLKANGKDAYAPLEVHRNAIGAMIAAEEYATELFANGGVPPLVLSGPPASSPGANDRASDQITEALRIGKNRNRKVLAVPQSFELKNLGFDPSKQQLIELRRFQVSESSRIFNVAPAMLHDLTTGTYSNVEQQNLNFAQQTILPLVKMIEQELNLKLFGVRNTTNYVEFNVDALVRGDLLSRMEALARAVNSALLTPNEARALDNREAKPHGDKLYMQSATTALGSTPAPVEPTVPANEPTTEETPKDNEEDNGEA
jgi:HK97 family phage portal protein